MQNAPNAPMERERADAHKSTRHEKFLQDNGPVSCRVGGPGLPRGPRAFQYEYRPLKWNTLEYGG